MARNVEIKARVRDAAALSARAAALTDAGPSTSSRTTPSSPAPTGA